MKKVNKREIFYKSFLYLYKNIASLADDKQVEKKKLV